MSSGWIAAVSFRQSYRSYIHSFPHTKFSMAEKSDKKEKDKKPDLGLLEEDDEFEEFPAEDWTGADEDEKDVNVWEDNWDDDNVEDDFSVQLRNELEKQGKSLDGQEAMKT